MGALTRLLNVPALIRHLSQNRAGRSVWDPADDLELALYGAVFGNNFLHYGYFPEPPADPESISLADVKQAAVEALANIGGARAIEVMATLLKDEDPEIRRIAAEALGKKR